MKSVAVILGLSCLLVLMVTPPASASGDNDVNDVSDKESYEKKERDKKDFRRYEDWGMDWSDADMMQHPIDEGPRRVSNTSSSTNFCILHKDPPHLPSFLPSYLYLIINLGFPCASSSHLLFPFFQLLFPRYFFVWYFSCYLFLE